MFNFLSFLRRGKRTILDTGLESNLLNFISDEIYAVAGGDVLNYIKMYLDDESLRILENDKDLQNISFVVAGDTYFIHNLMDPRVRGDDSPNPNNVLEGVRKGIVKYMGSGDYFRARSVCINDPFLSRFYAVRVAIEFLKAILKKAKEQDMDKPSKQMSKDEVSKCMGIAFKRAGRQLDAVKTLSDAYGSMEELMKKVEERERKSGGDINEPGGDQRGSDQGSGNQNNDAKNTMDSGGDPPAKTGTGFRLILDLADRLIDTDLATEIIQLGEEIAQEVITSKRKEETVRSSIREGYRFTSRIDKAIPRELALPDEILDYKIANKKLLTYEYIEEPSGSIYVVIDKSGSMDNREKTVWSRSVAYALFKKAIAENKRYFLRFFDTEVYPHPNKPPFEDPIDVVQKLLKVRSEGGTAIDYALDVAVKDIARENLSDKVNSIILITDGEDDVNTKPEKLKSHNIVLNSVMIDGENKDLKKLSESTEGKYSKAVLDAEHGKRILKIVDETTKRLESKKNISQ